MSIGGSILKKLLESQKSRFLLVGCLNTLVGYGFYALFLWMQIPYLIANTLSTICGVIHSYFWNRYFTFKSKQKAWKEITKFITVYGISYMMSICFLFILVKKLGINPYVSGVFNVGITTIISWFGHKYFSFRSNPILKTRKKKSPPKSNILAKDFEYFIKSKMFIYPVIILALLGYGFAITHSTVNIDTLSHVRYYQGGEFIAQGRFAAALFDNIFHIMGFNPFFNDCLSVMLLIVASISFCIVFKRITHDKLKTISYSNLNFIKP